MKPCYSIMLRYINSFENKYAGLGLFNLISNMGGSKKNERISLNLLRIDFFASNAYKFHFGPHCVVCIYVLQFMAYPFLIP